MIDGISSSNWNFDIGGGGDDIGPDTGSDIDSGGIESGGLGEDATGLGDDSADTSFSDAIAEPQDEGPSAESIDDIRQEEGEELEAGEKAETFASAFNSDAEGMEGHVESSSHEGDGTNTPEKEAHAEAGFSVDYDQGRAAAMFDLGASTKQEKSAQWQGETELGPLKLRGESEAKGGVETHAGAGSSTEIDLSRGSLNHNSHAEIGIEAKTQARAASELEAFGVTRRDEVSASKTAQAQAGAENSIQMDRESVAISGGAGASASTRADAAYTQQYSTDHGTVGMGGRAEARAEAEAHANGHFKSTEDTLELGGNLGAGAGANVMGELSVNGATKNGSSFDFTGGGNVGASVGANAGFDFSRRPGETHLGLEAGGSIVAGLHGQGQLTVKDRDIAEASTAPAQALGSAYSGIGEAAGGAAVLTEGLRQRTAQNQDFLDGMGSVPTGNMIADAGIKMAGSAHGVYQNGVEFADTLAEEAQHAYSAAGRRVSGAANAATDMVENVVGNTLDTGARTVNQAYRMLKFW